MPEEVLSQAAQPGEVNPASVQVPESTAQGASAQPQEPQKEQRPLTIEDVQREATRIAQSMVAKGENRIQKQIQEKFAALEATKKVLNLTDEQVKRAKQDIVTEAYAAEPQGESVTTDGPGANPEVDQAIQYLNAQIDGVFADVGEKITPADPEMKELQAVIDAAWNDPNGLVKIIRTADRLANAKKVRLQKQAETAPARIVGGGGITGGNAVTGSGREMLSSVFGRK